MNKPILQRIMTQAEAGALVTRATQPPVLSAHRKSWADLDRLYASLPTIECRRLCQASCGPIFMGYAEWARVKLLGKRPMGEQTKHLVCPMLKEGLCQVYEHRPAICRLWGLTEAMRCPWGCEPRPRAWTEEEGRVFLGKVDEISNRLERWIIHRSGQKAPVETFDKFVGRRIAQRVAEAKLEEVNHGSI